MINIRSWLVGTALVSAGALPVAAGIAVAVTAAASTGITINAGGCAGGGSGYCYSPEGASGQTGTTVTWTNQSGAAHTVTRCDSSACPSAPANPAGGDTFNVAVNGANGSTGSFTFTQPGTYYYYCAIHGYALMHGTITVSAPATPAPTSSTSASNTGGSTPSSTGAGAGTPPTGSGPLLSPPVVALVALSLGAWGVGLAAYRRTRETGPRDLPRR